MLGQVFDFAAALAQRGEVLGGGSLLQGESDMLLVKGSLPRLSKPNRALLMLVLRTAVAAAVEVVGAVTRDALFTCARWRLVVAMQKRLFASLLRQEAAFFDGHSTGTLASRIVNDTEDMQQVVTSGAQRLLSALLNISAGGLLMFTLSPQMAALGMLAVPCVLLGTGGAAKAIGILGLLQNDLLADISAIATEVLANVHTVKANAAEDIELKRYSACQDASMRVLRESVIAESFFKQTKQLLLLATDLGLLAFGMSSVVQGRLTIGRFMSFRSYMRKFYLGLDALTDIYKDLQYSLMASERYFEFVDRRPTVAAATRTALGTIGSQATPSEGPRGLAEKLGPALVEFKDVSFAYAPVNNAAEESLASDELRSPLILKNFSLRVPPGEVLALVGTSGAGKSTVVKLAQRFYDPQSGAVLMDGLDLRSVDMKALRQAVAYVEQEPLLFKRSVADNIAYGLRPLEDTSDAWIRKRERAYVLEQQRQRHDGQMQQHGETEEDAYEAELERTLRHPEAAGWPSGLLQRVLAAAVSANALPFIRQLPDGLFTLCGEGAVRLSGGQKQRIAVARAVLRNPRLLILDEASSCLDADSEAALAETLKRLKGKTTVITIAHKPSSFRQVDRVAFIEDGRIAEEGTPAELLSNKRSKYAELVGGTYTPNVAAKSNDSMQAVPFQAEVFLKTIANRLHEPLHEMRISSRISAAIACAPARRIQTLKKQ
ncbi:ATP-binding cassette sub-family B member 8, mitochondrial [Cyclospora cayetanensis]|uniref:ATP-binding cassette sub-family B member 8, mitochondrial n=1 Tax=Cyclospora cayetanensis TaxID=88456 RepID=A0A6P6S1L1_9EIME|nr:ATP-binding cassette sub-family B member 8, mitochondrial [Cyclospora cayetanensis]